MQKVVVKCKGSSTRTIDELEGFQGNLKSLSEENYQKFKGDLLELGFCEPIVIWNNNILNGHQRIKTLKRMIEEGVEVPALPVAEVKAKSKKEAKKIILSLTSQYGKMTNQSLLEFMKDNGFDLSDVEDFSFSDVDMPSLESIFNEQSGALDEIEEIEDIDIVPDVDVQGDVKNLTEYLIIVFDTKEEYDAIHDKLELPGIQRRIEYGTFKEKFKDIMDA